MYIRPTWDEEGKEGGDYDKSLIDQYKEAFSGGECMTFDECPDYIDTYKENIEL